MDIMTIMNEELDIAREFFRGAEGQVETGDPLEFFPLDGQQVEKLSADPGAILASKIHPGDRGLIATSGIGVSADVAIGGHGLNVPSSSDFGYVFKLIATTRALDLIPQQPSNLTLYPVLVHENLDPSQDPPGVIIWADLWETASEFQIIPDGDPLEVLASLDRDILNYIPGNFEDLDQDEILKMIELLQQKLNLTRQIFGILDRLADDHNLDSADEVLSNIYPFRNEAGPENLFLLEQIEDDNAGWHEAGIPSYLKAKEIVKKIRMLIANYLDSSADNYLVNDFFARALNIPTDENSRIDYIDRLFHILNFLYMKTSIMSDRVQQELFEEILFFILISDIKKLPDAYHKLGNLVAGILSTDKRLDIEELIDGLDENDPSELESKRICLRILDELRSEIV